MADRRRSLGRPGQVFEDPDQIAAKLIRNGMKETRAKLLPLHLRGPFRVNRVSWCQGWTIENHYQTIYSYSGPAGHVYGGSTVKVQHKGFEAKFPYRNQDTESVFAEIEQELNPPPVPEHKPRHDEDYSYYDWD